MTHGSLYSGIGGWLLAAEWAGIKNIFTCEIEDFPNKVLDKHFPDTDRHHDIKETDFTKYAGRIDILSTSDPCQPFSFAGKRGGKADDRFLWPETIRVIREVRPSYVVFENVPGYVELALDQIIVDLEALAYKTEQYIIPAGSIGASHKRDRLWVVAYSKSIRRKNKRKNETRNTSKGIPNRRCEPEPLDSSKLRELGIATTLREANGVPNRVDRLKSLGNAIVPQIAYLIFEAIKEIN